MREPRLIVDLFLNYDCDLEAKNIVANMCDGLSRLTVAQTPLTETAEQDTTLKNMALETMVAITDSMVQWEREGRETTARLSTMESMVRAASPYAATDVHLLPYSMHQRLTGHMLLHTGRRLPIPMPARSHA